MRTVSIIYLYIKYVLSPKPDIINQIILLIADPRRSEHFGHLTTALLLHLSTFDSTWLDYFSIFTGNSI